MVRSVAPLLSLPLLIHHTNTIPPPLAPYRYGQEMASDCCRDEDEDGQAVLGEIS
jgi:hypothetical protein